MVTTLLQFNIFQFNGFFTNCYHLFKLKICNRTLKENNRVHIPNITLKIKYTEKKRSGN